MSRSSRNPQIMLSYTETLGLDQPEQPQQLWRLQEKVSPALGPLEGSCCNFILLKRAWCSLGVEKHLQS